MQWYIATHTSHDSNLVWMLFLWASMLVLRKGYLSQKSHMKGFNFSWTALLRVLRLFEFGFLSNFAHIWIISIFRGQDICASKSPFFSQMIYCNKYNWKVRSLNEKLNGEFQDFFEWQTLCHKYHIVVDRFMSFQVTTLTESFHKYFALKRHFSCVNSFMYF